MTTPTDMQANQYRKKPVVIDAFRVEQRALWPDWFHDAVSSNVVITHGMGKFGEGPVYCEIKTLEGVMRADDGDWIIRGVKGELYPCKPDIFAATYEPAASRPDAQADERGASQDESDLCERIIHAVEGECDGLAITEEQTSNILAYLQYGEPMCDMPEAFHIVDNAIGAAENYEPEGGNLRIVTLRIDAARKVRAALASQTAEQTSERGEQGEAKGVCQRCGGTGFVDDGELTGVGGMEFENGPVRRVKDCPDCDASAPTLSEQQACTCKGSLGHARTCPMFNESMVRYEPFASEIERIERAKGKRKVTVQLWQREGGELCSTIDGRGSAHEYAYVLIGEHTFEVEGE